MLYSAAEEYEAIMLWLNGPLSFSFLWIQIFIGGIVPLLLLSHPKTGKTYLGQGLAGALVVIGTFAMRFNVIVGGQMIPKSEAGLVPYTHEIGYIGYTLFEEILLLIGIIAFGTIAYILALKYTPKIVTLVDGLIGKSAFERVTEVPMELEE
jgi:Ni/Fe-hydrogenase subunit HybB-like protein